MEKIQMLCVPTGREFMFNGIRYTRIPDMILKNRGWNFVINCLWIVDNEDPYEPITKMVDFIGMSTEVEMI